MTAWGSFTLLGKGTGSALAPGTYNLTATLKVAGSDGWNGSVTTPPVTIRTGPEPSARTANQEDTKAILVAQYAANNSDLATAASAIAGLLASQHDNVDAMTTNAVLLEQAGRVENGKPCMVCLEKATPGKDQSYIIDYRSGKSRDFLCWRWRRITHSLSTTEVR